MSQERLQKVLAHAGVASRRASEQMILDGRVSVNGKIVLELGTKVDLGVDDIQVDGKSVRPVEKYVYILLNKPLETVTTTSDPQDRTTVLDVVGDIDTRIYPVGRLDYDTEGVLLLTNDGTLTHALTHPSHQVDKTYRVVAEGTIHDDDLRRLARGIDLDDGPTAPAAVELLDRNAASSRFLLTIHEGRNRQVRRMCDAVGHPVIHLRRVQLGPLRLENLRPGDWRYLDHDEIRGLKKSVGIQPLQ